MENDFMAQDVQTPDNVSHYPVGSDTESASETESALWQDHEGVHYNIDIDQVSMPPPHMFLQPVSPRKNVQKEQKSQGVQVDVPITHELAELRAEVQNLRRENKALKLKERGNQRSAKDRAEKKFEWMQETEEKFYFFTGLEVKEFSVLYEFLNPESADLVFWKEESKGKPTLSFKCQLAMTLWRLRRGITITELSSHFDICHEMISRIFITWIQFIYHTFNDIRSAMFVPREFHKPVPSGFRNAMLRDTRIVIDCTELFTESSRDYSQQGNMYSSYKSHATYKVLIGVAPCGACMFVSDAFEGSISDKQIVKDSKFIDHLAPGDVVLADRGFTIHDLCAQKGATLEIPPFKDGRPALTKDELHKTKLISRARIHVERFNERIKKYRILSGIIPLELVPLLSQIVFITCCLANFKEPLAK